MSAVQSLRELSIEDLLFPILVQLTIIILAARLVAILLRRIGQPGVVGEICAGLILGPSVFGLLFPDAFRIVFQPTLPQVPDELGKVLVPKIFAILSQIGLIFLLFLVGLESDFTHLRVKGRSAVAISLVGIGFPFLLGWLLAPMIHPYLESVPGRGPVDETGFALFLGVALSITAIPVLARIMMELNITRTRIGAITITAAAVNDAVGWILLAAVAAAVKTGFAPSETLWMVSETIAFGLAMIFVVRPIMARWLRRTLEKQNGRLGATAFAIVLACMLIGSIITNRIGIFAIFGAFLFGAVLSDLAAFRIAMNGRIRDVVMGFFLPIFFMNTGLRTDLGSLHSPTMWLIGLLVVIASIFGKWLGCSLAARLSGFSGRESAIIGTLMNARGLMELIIVNLGYEMGVIPKSVYCILVMMAMLTTMMTTPLLMRLMPGTELEPYIRESEFLGFRRYT